MKKNVIILIFILLIIIVICFVGIKRNYRVKIGVTQENKQYEQYLESEIYGTSVITLINQAITHNEDNNISKDEKGFYINNNQNSIQIELIMITNEEKGETQRYKMEAIDKAGIEDFIKNFNITKFKCTNKQYHSQTGKLKYIELTQTSQ